MIRLLHFSDIHFKYPDCCNLDTDPNVSIRDTLRVDISDYCSKDSKNIDAILITGDIAFSGRQEEYEAASSWIEELCESTGCSKLDVYVVPGNHDVNRTDADQLILNTIREALSNLKDEKERTSQLDKYLSDSTASNVILYPMQNYNTFAAKYSCGISDKKTFWNQNIPISEDVNLSIRGLTTTVLSSKKDSCGKLIIDQRQTNFRKEAGQLYLTMMHHPCDWFINSDNIRDQLDNHIQIQLFGHKHRSRYDYGDNHIRVSAISLHPDKDELGYEPGYNIIDLIHDGKKDNKEIIKAKLVVRTLQFNPMKFISKSFHHNDFILKTFEINSKPKSKNSHNRSEPSIEINTPIIVKQEELINTPKEQEINIKELSYDFYQLRGSDKREILNNLNLLSDEEWELSDVERQKVAFHQAITRGSLQLLQKAIIEKGYLYER